MKNTALQYFEAFSKRDINALSGMFSKDVTLKDWEINAIGVDAVLDANAKIFSVVKNLTVKPLNVYLDGNTVIAELEITINGSKSIKVIDVIEFTNAGKICAIRAYKG